MTGREFSCYPDVFVTLLNGVSCQTSFVNNWAFFVSYGERPSFLIASSGLMKMSRKIFKKNCPPLSTFEFGGQSGDNYEMPKTTYN